MGYRNYKEAALDLGVGYDWLRRAVTRGIGWTRGENPDLGKLAQYFGVPKDAFWEDSPDRFEMAVLANAKPDHIAHCVTLEGVLRHYGSHRPDLLKRCLDVITHYKEKIAEPSSASPEDYYCFVEARTTDFVRLWERGASISDKAVEERLSRLRLLPKREILEEVVKARINEERRQDRLRSFRYEESWDRAKSEIVNMTVCVLSEFIQQERELNDQERAALVALAERYAQRLREGEFAPTPEIETARSKLPTRSRRRRVVPPHPFRSESTQLPSESRSTGDIRLPVEPKIPGDSSPKANAAKSGKLTPETLAVPGVREVAVPFEQGSPDDSSINLQHVLIKWTGSKRR